MGLFTLFDKSFLQGLTLDESVWFDNFFSPVVAPIFYVETLADLAKPPRSGTPPDREVARIAEKFPEMQATPVVSHTTMVVANLLGHPVPMDGRIVVPGPQPVRTEDDVGVLYRPSPEVEAFSRWTRQEFLALETSIARVWRATLETLDVEAVARELRRVGIDGRGCQSLAEVKAMARALTSDLSIGTSPLQLSLLFASADRDLRDDVMSRYRKLVNPSFSAFAPYAAFVLEVEVFFNLAVGAGLIGGKPSNRTDIAYLFYLPFCMLFVSSDRLHETCSRHFLREDQKFLWGLDLKDGLAQLHEHYKGLPDEVKEEGVMRFAVWPPRSDEFLVSRIFDEHFPGWRDRPERTQLNPEAEKALADKLNRMLEAPKLSGDALREFNPREATFMSMQRMVRKKRGSWYQVPKGMTDVERKR